MRTGNARFAQPVSPLPPVAASAQPHATDAQHLRHVRTSAEDLRHCLSGEIMAPMSTLQTIDLDFRPLYGGTVQMVLVVDSRNLADLAGEFASRAGYEPAGGYAGLVLEHYDFGDLSLYLMGEQVPWPGHEVALLGCECGEWGCWPLVAHVAAADGVVEWSEFRQPHRAERRYQGFGPFRFPEKRYRLAVAAAAQRSK